MKLRLRTLILAAPMAIASATATTLLPTITTWPAELNAQQQQALAPVACKTTLNSANGYRFTEDASGDLHASVVCNTHRLIESHEVVAAVSCRLADTGWKCEDVGELVDMALPEGHVVVSSWHSIPLEEAVQAVSDLVAAGRISPRTQDSTHGPVDACSISESTRIQSEIQVGCGSFNGTARRVASGAEVRYEVTEAVTGESSEKQSD
jgi:hypothetical protein